MAIFFRGPTASFIGTAQTFYALVLVCLSDSAAPRLLVSTRFFDAMAALVQALAPPSCGIPWIGAVRPT
jgi:hypothetical protein